MKLVLDSNIYIAAFATRGLCSDIFEYCIKNCEIVSCKEIKAEVKNKLIKKIKIPKKIVEEILHFISEKTISFIPQKVSIDACRDKNDLMVQGLALAVNAKYIVTGDKDLLVLNKIGKTKIITPREFWRELREGK